MSRVVAVSLALFAAPTAAQAQNAALILHGGKVYTVNPEQAWAEAVAIDSSGKISAVGNDAEVLALAADNTERINLRGRLLLPGFQDTHAHVLDASSAAQGDCTLDPSDALDDWLDAIADCRVAKPNGWLRGTGFALHTLLEAEQSPRQLLDEIGDLQPIILMEETSHAYWLNSAALERSGVQDGDPTGGIVLRDADGEANGILLDNAGDLALDAALPTSPELDSINDQAIADSQYELARNGITSVADARTFWRRGHYQAWLRAARNGGLSARTVLSLWAYPHLDDDSQLAELKAMLDTDGSDLLRVTQIKFYVDGIVHNSTARLLQPYQHSLAGVDPLGLYYFTPKRLNRYARELSRAGFDMHIHAIGDGAVHDALNAIAKTAGKGRHRITHVELVDDRDIPRFARLNVTADFQPSAYFLNENLREHEPAIGKRAQSLLNIRKLHDSGARVTLSSDWDVNPLSPLGIIASALRLGERGLPDVESTLKAYTIDAAYVLRQEHETGSIEVGKWADLVVLDTDLFAASVDEIEGAKVLRTLLGGEEIYRADGS